MNLVYRLLQLRLSALPSMLLAVTFTVIFLAAHFKPAAAQTTPQKQSASAPGAKANDSQVESAVSRFSRREEELPKGPTPRLGTAIPIYPAIGYRRAPTNPSETSVRICPATNCHLPKRVERHSSTTSSTRLIPKASASSGAFRVTMPVHCPSSYSRAPSMSCFFIGIQPIA